MRLCELHRSQASFLGYVGMRHSPSADAGHTGSYCVNGVNPSGQGRDSDRNSERKNAADLCINFLFLYIGSFPRLAYPLEMEQQHIRRIRMFLDLRQVDVERATGISMARLSKAEAGALMLTRTEQIRLDNFLRDRMRIIAEIDNEARCLDSERLAGHVTA